MSTPSLVTQINLMQETASTPSLVTQINLMQETVSTPSLVTQIILTFISLYTVLFVLWDALTNSIPRRILRQTDIHDRLCNLCDYSNVSLKRDVKLNFVLLCVAFPLLVLTVLRSHS